MRSTKQLLQLTLREGNLNFNKGIPNDDLYEKGFIGLCGFVSNLYHIHMIDYREFDTLNQFIELHRPKENSPLRTKNYSNGSAYYWPRGKWAPRKRWLEYHIKSR